jgi:hypothetical protein
MEFCSICFENLSEEISSPSTPPHSFQLLDSSSSSQDPQHLRDNPSPSALDPQEFSSSPQYPLLSSSPLRPRPRQCSSHFFACASCYKSYIQNEINRAAILPNGNLTCYCPNRNNCLTQITQQDILSLLSSPSDDSGAPDASTSDDDSRHLIEKYHHFYQNILVITDPTKLWCPRYSQCHGVARILKYSKAQCDQCSYVFCSKCHQQHSSYRYSFCLLSTNKQKNKNDPYGQAELQKWKRSKGNGGKCKKCPRCRNSIEKNGGCNHMTCTLCGYEFCWCCKSKYTNTSGCTSRFCPLIEFESFHHKSCL